MTINTTHDHHALVEEAARWHAQIMLGKRSLKDEQALDARLAQSVQHRLTYAEGAAAGRAFAQTTTPVTATLPIQDPAAALYAIARANCLAVRHIPGIVYVAQES